MDAVAVSMCSQFEGGDIPGGLVQGVLQPRERHTSTRLIFRLRITFIEIAPVSLFVRAHSPAFPFNVTRTLDSHTEHRPPLLNTES